MRWGLLLLLLALPGCGQAWHTELAYAGTDIWSLRLPITIANPGPEAVAGQPVELSAAALAGRAADALRVCDDAGAEQLWDLRDAAGRRVEAGPIPDGARLIVPATAPAGGTQRLWVYLDNPTAYRVPDFLAATAGPANGGFESGDATPDEWRFDGGDEQHALALDGAVRRGGQRSVRCAVAAGAAPTWIAARQLDRPVKPGARYALRGWVRAQEVVGSAGWYVHVATAGNPQAVNLVQNAGAGSYDWREVTIEFTAPPGAVSMSYGTVLYGTGTAWFDDFSVTTDAREAPLTASLGEPEPLTLQATAPTTQLSPEPWIRLRAVQHQVGPAADQALIAFPVRRLLAALGERAGDARLAAVMPRGGPQPLHRFGDLALLSQATPANSSREFHIIAASPSRRTDESDEALLRTAANLAPNPSFEGGDPAAAGWQGGTEGEPADGIRLERVRGGKFGGWCLRITVPPGTPRRWVGWRYRAPVQPGRSYLFSAWVRGEQITGGQVRLHGHLRDAAGELAGSSPYWSSPGSISGTTDWTQLGGEVTIPPGVAFFELHLTADVRGVIEHDGVLFAPVLLARAGELLDTRTPPLNGLAARVVDPLIKVFRDTPIRPGEETARLFAARGEREALQLALRSDQAEPVTVTAGELRGAAGTLPAPRLERVGYVPVLEPSGYHQVTVPAWQRKVTRGAARTDGWTGWWPDFLAPVDGPLTLAPRRTQPLWLTYAVPADAAPGEYRGEVQLRSPRATVTVPVSLTVWRYRQPERPSLQVIYDLRNGPGPRAFTDGESTRAWWRFMAERRISSDRVLPDPSFRLDNGRVVMDAAAFDAAARVYFDELHLAAAYWPPIFYAAGWAFPPREFLGTTYPSPEYNAAYSEAVRLFQAHLRERGWDQRMFLYLSDEPHFWSAEQGDAVRRQLGDVMKLIRAAAPEVRVYSSTWRHEPAWDGLLNHWGIAQYGGFPVDEMARRRAAGDLLWFTTDGQMEIDTPYNACERLLPWYCFAHDVAGYEFWGLTWYTFDPYRFGWHSYIQQSDGPASEAYWVRYPNGDGYLAYPGEPLGVPGPVSSIRLEQAREGIEDYELFRALAGRPEAAADQRVTAILDQVRRLAAIPNAGGYRSTEILPEPSRLTALRQRAGELLDELLRESAQGETP